MPTREHKKTTNYVLLRDRKVRMSVHFDHKCIFITVCFAFVSCTIWFRFSFRVSSAKWL